MTEIQLSSGDRNGSIRIDSVSEHIEIPLQFGRNTLSRHLNKIKLNHICFTTIQEHGRLNVSFLREITISLKFRDQIIATHDIGFFIDLCGIKIINEAYCVALPYNFMFGEILLSAMDENDLCIDIRCSSSVVDVDMTLFVENINTREEIVTQQMHDIQLVNEFCHETTTCSNIRIRLNTNNVKFIKGLFICGDVGLIKRMELCLSGRSRFVYGKTMIGLYCKKISENMFYVPLNQETNYEDVRMETYFNSLNCDGVRDIRINFDFEPSDNSQKTIRVYGIHHNIITYEDGRTFFARTRVDAEEQQRLRRQRVIEQFFQSPTNSRFSTTKLLETEPRICPITQENITEFYGKCSDCNNVFDFNAINSWLQNNRTCPTCRGVWKNNTKYRRTIG